MSTPHDDLPGLLTQSDRQRLTGTATQPTDDRTGDGHTLRERIRGALLDFEFLYLHLTDDALADIFTGGDATGTDRGLLRAAAQHTVALLYHGLALTDDAVEYRIASAIVTAEAAREHHATVNLDIHTEPFLPPEQRLDALARDGFDRVSWPAFEHLLYDDRVPPADITAALSAHDESPLSAETIKHERDAAGSIERVPMPVVTDVTVASDSDGEGPHP